MYPGFIDISIPVTVQIAPLLFFLILAQNIEGKVSRLKKLVLLYIDIFFLFLRVYS